MKNIMFNTENGENKVIGTVGMTDKGIAKTKKIGRENLEKHLRVVVENGRKVCSMTELLDMLDSKYGGSNWRANDDSLKMLFARNFITPIMRGDLPIIAYECIRNMSDIFKDDALVHRGYFGDESQDCICDVIISLILYRLADLALKGSEECMGRLILLYKVYHHDEYEKLNVNKLFSFDDFYRIYVSEHQGEYTKDIVSLSSRLFFMCRMLGKQIEPSCNSLGNMLEFYAANLLNKKENNPSMKADMMLRGEKEMHNIINALIDDNRGKDILIKDIGYDNRKKDNKIKMLEDEHKEMDKTIIELRDKVRCLEYSLKESLQLQTDYRKKLRQYESNDSIKYDEALSVPSNGETCDTGEEKDDIIIDELKKRKIAIIGGKDNDFKQLRETLPGLKIFPVSVKNLSFESLRNDDYVFFYCNTLNHKMYNNIKDDLKRRNKKVFYVQNLNAKIVIIDMWKYISKEERLDNPIELDALSGVA